MNSLSPQSFFRPWEHRIDSPFFMRELERLDDLSLMKDEHLFAMRADGSHDVLAFEFSADKVRHPADPNFTIGVDLTHKRNLALCEGQLKMTLLVEKLVQGESLRQLAERLSVFGSKLSRKPRTMIFLSESSMWLLKVIVFQESPTDFAKPRQGGAGMASEHAVLPEAVKALHSRISSRFPGWDEHHVNAQEQVESNNVGDAVLVSSTTGGSHLVVKLRYPRNAHPAPAVDEVATQRQGAFVAVLTNRSGMPRHIQGMEGVESYNSPWPFEVSRSHQIRLVEITHLLGGNVWVGLSTGYLAFLETFLRCPMARENTSDRRKGRNAPTTLLAKLPLDDLWTDARKLSSPSPVFFKLIADGEHSSHQNLRCLSVDSFRRAALITQAFDSMFSISPEPFRQPSLAPMHLPEDLSEPTACFMELYCLAAYIIFTLFFHRFALLRLYRRIAIR